MSNQTERATLWNHRKSVSPAEVFPLKPPDLKTATLREMIKAGAVSLRKEPEGFGLEIVPQEGVNIGPRTLLS